MVAADYLGKGLGRGAWARDRNSMRQRVQSVIRFLPRPQAPGPIATLAKDC